MRMRLEEGENVGLSNLDDSASGSYAAFPLWALCLFPMMGQ